MTEKSNLKVVREKEYWLSPIALSSFQAPLPSEIEVRKYKMFFPVAQEMKNEGRLERATRRIVEEAEDGDQGPGVFCVNGLTGRAGLLTILRLNHSSST